MTDLQKASQKAQEFRKREEEILERAQELFIAHGEDKVTVEMIADAVNIGKGTIYKHFETKDEIYLRLMIRYEEELAEMFDRLNEGDSKDRAKLAKDYFSFRMKDPDKYALFDRLEHKLTNKTSCPDLVSKLHEIRASNLDKLAGVIKAKIDDGTLEDVPPYFHIFAAWALVHGAVALYHSKFYQEFIEDKDAFFNFLGDVGIRMGNRRSK
ncbi:MAG: TetR family transcriptional regulator [Pseudomonadales bacterium]|jgi:AcrR family transcriptional regulator|nr:MULTISPECIES: TetR/AcrR family transcriptional regulator [unclassified Ketobacter]MAQ25687.1 TetR family transcriptional regulator [Pseudomonadales bacterium]RLT89958.1 MAG: TetR/AcrR family transcriptional regulator [Ketobacter sp. GenoA1]RLT98969.1 MAG: TetR/AcrR family transcriptional regulator [Ketobacter sp.]TNC90340.1 MAG: TetR family transcriptional regulator [Alcanivorax sp.]HAG96935.1 TetR/AcrR family transcriptional regulator [Gammaproteobacteria bacterium]|tara:strand:- start:59402 stop:60034 length:633 start_codon:yes stop_codon:yes gene_type:complete